MNFRYYYQEQPTEDLEIDDVANVCIIANNDAGLEYYLILSTDFGLTKMLTYGPAIPDVEELPLNVNYSYSQFETNEMKLQKIIDKFLNNSGITQARIVDKEDIIPNIRRFDDYI